MRHIFQFLIAINMTTPALICAGSEPPSQLLTSSQTERMSPLACNALALSSEARKRHFQEVGPALLKLKKSSRELPDGYEFEFPADQNTYQMLTEWVFQERLCCPFFDLAVRFDREGGPLWLRATGRPGTKDFIKGDGAAWIRQQGNG